MAAIRLFYSVFARIEYEYRPEEYVSSWYRSGIETTDFLFEICNFMNGVGSLNNSYEKEFLNAETEEKREEIRQKLSQTGNYILNGGHLDILLTIMNL